MHYGCGFINPSDRPCTMDVGLLIPLTDHVLWMFINPSDRPCLIDVGLLIPLLN